MEWILSTEKTLKDIKSGFVIHLESGSWLEPANLKAESPDGMIAQDQVKYLRLGLQFAREFMAKRL